MSFNDNPTHITLVARSITSSGMLVMPRTTNIATWPIAQPGALAYDTTADLVYQSDGSTWSAVGAGAPPETLQETLAAGNTTVDQNIVLTDGTNFQVGTAAVLSQDGTDAKLEATAGNTVSLHASGSTSSLVVGTASGITGTSNAIISFSTSSVNLSAIELESSAGGININAASQLTLLSTSGGASAVNINAVNGGVAITSDVGAITQTAAGAIAISSTGSTITQTSSGNFNIESTGAALTLDSSTATTVGSSGTLDLTAAGIVTLESTGAALDITGSGPVTIVSSGNTLDLTGSQDTTIESISGALNALSSGALTIASSGSTIDMTSAGAMALESTASTVTVTSDEALNLISLTSTVDVTSAGAATLESTGSTATVTSDGLATLESTSDDAAIVASTDVLIQTPLRSISTGLISSGTTAGPSINSVHGRIDMTLPDSAGGNISFANARVGATTSILYSVDSLGNNPSDLHFSSRSVPGNMIIQWQNADSVNRGISLHFLLVNPV